MPFGVLLDCSSVLIGGLIGSLLGHRLKKDFCDKLTMIFGVSSISMGVSAIVKVTNLPPVILAVILGVIIGELCHLEDLISKGAQKLKGPISRICKTDSKSDDEVFMTKFISIIVLFCASGTGIFGSLQSGITNDHTILISKSILDFFTAAIFAASLGAIVMLVAVPQLVIMLVLFFSSAIIMPLTTPLMLNDFTACGGILMLATGFRICDIKKFPVANMLPAMALVMPFSALWTQIFG